MYATPIPCPLIHSAFKLLWEGATFVVLLFFLGHVIDFLLLFNIMNCINLLFISLKLIFTSVFFLSRLFPLLSHSILLHYSL